MEISAKAAREALSVGDFNACAQIASKLSPRTAGEAADAYLLMALALDGVGKVREALKCAQKSVELAAAADNCALLARLNVQLHQDAAARAAADMALAQPAPSAVTLDTIGNVYARLGDHRTAIQAFERAVKADPEITSYRFNLAASYGFFGETDKAEAQFQAVLAREPGHARAWSGLIRLRKQPQRLPALIDAIEAAPTPDDEVRLRYAAAKTAEDIGAHDEVFEQLSKANTLHKQTHHNAADLELENFAALKAAFESADYFQGQGNQSNAADAPIFITGMPRTGTTLTDRIISSHPEVTSAGELQAMPLAVKHMAQTSSRAILDRETIAALADVQPDALGAHYITRARQHEGARTGQFIDKFPLNVLYIGYIARALPHAPIICLRRNPLDTIWSNYKHLFATSSLYYRYAYDLEDAARYYIAFDALIAYWKTLFPGRIFELSYEGLVADQEPVTRALLAHCGLSWAPECLDFHTNTAAVATPSAAQVRQPLSNKSIGQWRHYEAHMGPAITLLQKAGIELPTA